ncbi:MAG: 2-dehydro-3-deoxy-D-gluconate 5-dehydrogenase [Lentisphaerae bacterium ADurb.Bin242]|nr:MAG: 2-dehydro-3-deoxy-D-gluconate 5-dehydrogenase [Lentisphaerae bacterium ADurb.Bin242]
MSILEKFRLEGKKALVTGAGRGLGRGFASALAEAGADVAVVDVIAENAERTAAEIAKATGRQIMSVHADITKPEDVRRMVEITVQTFGRLDIAVNNAGISIPIKSALDVTPEEWRKQMDVNLNGTWQCLREEARAMIPNGYGKIINIGSICGHVVWPDPQLPYSVSKAAIIHMTRAAAAEFIKHGIRVNCISPGVTKVDDLFPEVIDVFFKTAPIDRFGSPEDHQGALIFLASSLSDFVVGQEIVTDGGYTIM